MPWRRHLDEGATESSPRAKGNDMAWKEWAVGAAITVGGGANILYISTTAEDAAEAEVRKGLAPMEEKINEVHQSQLRIEEWFVEHLDKHPQ